MPAEFVEPHFITEAMDSKLVTPDRHDDAASLDHALRLRFDVLFRILFGESIVVPQGWAMDSLLFFQVASEVIRAMADQPSLQVVPPFKMQCHLGESNYLEILKIYLRREDCDWSGIPALRLEPVRKRLLAFVEKTSPGPRDFALNASAILDNERVGTAWGAVLGYFGTLPKTRILASAYGQGGYINAVNTILCNLDKPQLGVLGRGSVAQDLAKLRDKIRRQDFPSQTTSSVLREADGYSGPETSAAIRFISTFAQMHAAARVTSSQISAPVVHADGGEGALLADRLLRLAFSNSLHGSGKYFGYSFNLGSPLGRKIASSDASSIWPAIWTSAIRLAGNNEWKGLVRKFRQANLPANEALEKSEFRKLVGLLKIECPQLVLEQSGAERLMLRLNMTPLSDDAVAAADAPMRRLLSGAAAAGVAAGMHYAGIDLNASGFITAAGIVGAAVAPEFLKYGSPFFKNGIFSSRTTLLH